MSNVNLKVAKNTKNDEFYTCYEDIENELQNYQHQLKGKVIYCNCDDWQKSNFVKYFKNNFEELGIKKLIATCYTNEGNGKWCEVTADQTITGELNGDGSYASEECIDYLKEADFIITNPPFSRFIDFFKTLMQYNKKFLVIGNHTAAMYRDIFPYFKENKVWTGVARLTVFEVPNNYYRNVFINEDGAYMVKYGSFCCWYTNILPDNPDAKETVKMTKNYYGNESYYPKYDNYDAINVNKMKDIPCDYYGTMGVPITILKQYDPNVFEIIDNIDPTLNGKDLFARIIIKRK